jgi:hypothetical protein
MSPPTYGSPIILAGHGSFAAGRDVSTGGGSSTLGTAPSPLSQARKVASATKNLIGAVAIEDNKISFAYCTALPPHEVMLRKHFFSTPPNIKRVDKPEKGYSKEFIEEEIKNYFSDVIIKTKGNFASVGISMFGVINTRTSTLISVPKRDWYPKEGVLNINLNFASLFCSDMFRSDSWKESYPRIEVRNDATTAALGEAEEHDEGRKDREDMFVYLRVGAGINAGALWRGFPFGHLHPELGHIRPIKNTKDRHRSFKDCCGFHEDCYDGLASIPAIEKRRKYLSIYDVWHVEAFYLAQLCITLNATLAPNCIVLGGPAMHDEFIDINVDEFYDFIRNDFEILIGNYPRHEANENNKITSFIRPAKVTEDVSLWGALSLAQSCAVSKKKQVWSLDEARRKRREPKHELQ